jgi:hypothetical protein
MMMQQMLWDFDEVVYVSLRASWTLRRGECHGPSYRWAEATQYQAQLVREYIWFPHHLEDQEMNYQKKVISVLLLP